MTEGGNIAIGRFEFSRESVYIGACKIVARANISISVPPNSIIKHCCTIVHYGSCAMFLVYMGQENL